MPVAIVPVTIVPVFVPVAIIVSVIVTVTIMPPIPVVTSGEKTYRKNSQKP